MSRKARRDKRFMTYRIREYMWIDDYNCSNHIERKQTLAQVADSIHHRQRLLEHERSYPGHIKVFEERGDQRLVFDTAQKINLLEGF